MSYQNIKKNSHFAILYWCWLMLVSSIRLSVRSFVRSSFENIVKITGHTSGRKLVVLVSFFSLWRFFIFLLKAKQIKLYLKNTLSKQSKRFYENIMSRNTMIFNKYFLYQSWNLYVKNVDRWRKKLSHLVILQIHSLNASLEQQWDNWLNIRLKLFWFFLF